MQQPKGMLHVGANHRDVKQRRVSIFTVLLQLQLPQVFGQYRLSALHGVAPFARSPLSCFNGAARTVVSAISREMTRVNDCQI